MLFAKWQTVIELATKSEYTIMALPDTYTLTDSVTPAYRYTSGSGDSFTLPQTEMEDGRFVAKYPRKLIN